MCPNQSSAFESDVKRAFKEIYSGSVGRRLIDKITKSRHVAWITSGSVTETTFYSAIGAITKGQGSDAEIRLSLKTRPMISLDVQEMDSPFYIDLAHELIHVYHGFYGKNRHMGKSVCDKLWQNDEEYQTIVGFPSKNNKQRTKPKITENAIREEHGLPTIYTHLFASALQDPTLRQEVQVQAVAHRTHTAFLNLLQGPSFLESSNRIIFANSHQREVTLENFLASSADHAALGAPNPHSTPPVLGKIQARIQASLFNQR